MSVAFPGESAEYRASREDLLRKEIELRRATEAVAAARRELPPGGSVPQDYVFHCAGAAGAPAEVCMSQLFRPGLDSLAVYSFMFTSEMSSACPSCTSFLDAFDGAIEHVKQRANVAVVADAPLERILAHALDRGWRRLPLYSTAGSNYNRDYLGVTDGGSPLPMLNVFRRSADGVIRHFWGSELLFAGSDPGQDPRPTDSIDPQWGMFDFLPEGRGDFQPRLTYP